ncbi:MAG TPA: MerR family transcriptional regulator [Streptosporangiaceae bacterium]
MNDHTYTVGAVSRLAGVSVRTLHHYDRVGLLAPAGRNAAGYRLYSLPDLGRLQQILFYRALGFPLAEIMRIMADPGQDSGDHLRRQHRLLREQISHRRDMLAAIEKELEAGKMGIALTPEEQFEIFGTDKVGGEWAEEAERRWGDSEEWKQSQRRAATYSKQDWIEIQAEATSVNQRFLDAMRSGAPAGSGQAMDLAEEHRQHITRRFYDCDHAMHRGLAEMYLRDERFGKNYDDMAPGLAQYVHDAILANATRAAS